MGKIKNYVQQVIAELKLVHWPTGAQTAKWSVEVILLALIAGAGIFFVDWLGSLLLKFLT